MGKDQFLVRKVKEDLYCMRETTELPICFRHNRKIGNQNEENDSIKLKKVFKDKIAYKADFMHPGSPFSSAKALPARYRQLWEQK